MGLAEGAEQDTVAAVRELTGAAAAAVQRVAVTGPAGVLPSVFDVTGVATAAVAAATLAAADLLAARTGDAARTVRVDRRQVAAAFLSEALFTPIGWVRPAPWDPIAGDYPAADGWIRLHTNYADHRAGAVAALGIADRDDLDRTTIGSAVALRGRAELEQAVVDAGGCAAAMYTRDEWLAHPAGAATADAPLLGVAPRPGGAPPLAEMLGATDPPLRGVRVLDLTRVIAGPVCTRFLAAHGADVLRIDPVGFAEVPALLPVTTAGKRVAALDLRAAAGRRRFEELIAEADVLVSGLRPDALDRLGFDVTHLATINPALTTARLDAYGWTGPWSARRGFDSLVQMSTGIAEQGQRVNGSPGPRPLPAQALDHATGYLLAATVCQALAARVSSGAVSEITASLVATANLLSRFPTTDGLAGAPPDLGAADTEPVDTHWGPATAVPVPGAIDGITTAVLRAARPLGCDEPRFTGAADRGRTAPA